MKPRILKINIIIILVSVILFYPIAHVSTKYGLCYSEKKQISTKPFDIKNKIRTNFGKINSFIADLEIRDNTGGNIKGKIFYESLPNKMKFFLEYQTGEKIIKYVTDDSEIMYLPDKNIAIKTLPSKDSLSNSSSAVVDYINTDRAEITEDKHFYYYKIDLPAPENSLTNDETPLVMKTYINKKYYYTEKIIFLNKKGEQIEVQELKNYKLNSPIDEKEFTFSPPQDCKFIFRQEQ